MQIPSLHKANTKNISKETFKKQFSNTYSYLTTRNGFYTLYSSRVPSIALAEAWLHKIGSRDENWCLIESINDEECFFLFVSKNDVVQAYQCRISPVELLLIQRSKQVFTVGNITQLPIDVTAIETPPLTEDEQGPFALKTTKKWPIKTIVGVCTACCVAIVSVLALTPEPKPAVPPVPIDQYLAYRLAVNHAYSADEIFSQAVVLGGYGLSLPIGWRFHSIALQGDTLLLTANRTENGQRAVINAWLSQHPTLADYASVTLDSMTVVMPLRTTLQAWNDKIMPVEPSLTSVIDAFVALGWKISAVNHQDGIVSITTSWTADKVTTLSELSSLTHMVSILPIALSAMTLTPSAVFGQLTITMQLSFIGS